MVRATPGPDGLLAHQAAGVLGAPRYQGPAQQACVPPAGRLLCGGRVTHRNSWPAPLGRCGLLLGHLSPVEREGCSQDGGSRDSGSRDNDSFF